MITDRTPQTDESPRSIPATARRHWRQLLSPVALVLGAALFAPSPALAVIGTGLAEIQEQQVERFLQRIIDEDGGDQVWTWATMIHSCTKTLMFGSPEQDPEQAGVRFTPVAQRFLAQCALVKGFHERATPYEESAAVGPTTDTLQKRIQILDKILAEWMTDTSSEGVTVARRNEECARWIATKAEWAAMLARSGGLRESGEGVSANVKLSLAACAKSKGFDLRPEKRGAPLKALGDAARAEIEAAARGR